jgi:carbonic anhydrase
MNNVTAWLLVVPLLAAPAAVAENGGAAATAPPADCTWSYQGPTGPEHWWEICPPQNALCKAGQRQSPIDLDAAQPADLPRLGFDYRRTRFTVVEVYGGNELQAQAPQERAAERLYLLVGGESYRLVQFHFHTPSEHHLEGQEFPLELHILHANDLNELAVVGVFLREGSPNAAFQAFLDTIPEVGKPGGTAEVQPLDLLPARRGYFRYAGSLTTPACAEGVRWHVLQEPITASAEQIARFRARYPHTARPLQKQADRVLLRSRD